MLVSLQRLVNGDGLTEDTVAGRASVFWSGWHDKLSNSTIIECVRWQALVKFATVDQHQGAIVENKLASRIANAPTPDPSKPGYCLYLLSRTGLAHSDRKTLEFPNSLQ
jgi:hypothetical protein